MISRLRKTQRSKSTLNAKELFDNSESSFRTAYKKLMKKETLSKKEVIDITFDDMMLVNKWVFICGHSKRFEYSPLLIWFAVMFQWKINESR